MQEQNDRVDIAALYREEWEFVVRTLARFGVDDAQREDAAQEVFVVVLRRWGDRSTPLSSARNWLYGIARRVASTRRRSHRRHQQRLLRLPASEAGPGPDEILERWRERRALTLAIDRLDGRKREVFELVMVEAQAGPEVADALGLPVSTVYSRLRLARAQLHAEAHRLLTAGTQCRS